MTGAVHTAQTTTAYDADGDVTSQTVTDLTGGDSPRTATRTYNGYDQLASQTDPAGATTTLHLRRVREPGLARPTRTATSPSYAYDGDGHLLTTTLANYTGSPPGSQPAAPLVEESRAYDPAGPAGVGDRRDGPDHRLLLHRQRAARRRHASTAPDWSAVVHQRVRTPTTARATSSAVDQQRRDRHHLHRRRRRAGPPSRSPTRPAWTAARPSPTPPTTSRPASPRQRPRRGLADHVVHLRPGGQRAVPVGDRPRRGRPGGLVQRCPRRPAPPCADSVGGGQPATASGVTWDGSGARSPAPRAARSPRRARWWTPPARSPCRPG